MGLPIIQICDLTKRYDDQVALNHISLEIYDGEFITILGPSGCGKTTLMRLMAGFDDPDSGQLLLQGKNLLAFPPERRPVNMVFQSYALFPHMTVYDNIAFGLRCQRLPENEVRLRVEEMLKIVKLQHLAQRKPQQLSGGQQQRVAVARAVVNRPILLLLDEPFSALDYHLRRNMRIELKALQRRLGITFVFITHDQEEALSLSDRIVVMDHGEIEQIGTPRDIYEEPVNLHVAEFVGAANIFKTSVISTTETDVCLDIAGRPFYFKNKKRFSVNQKVNVVIRPEDIEVWGRGEIDDNTDMLPGKVCEVIYKGSTVDVIVELYNGQRILATEFFNEDDAELEYEINEKVLMRWQSGWEVLLADEN